MKEISVSKSIIPVGEFKASISKWLKSIQQTDHPIIITKNGRPAGVLTQRQATDVDKYPDEESHQPALDWRFSAAAAPMNHPPERTRK